jgi:hypothetical protein
MDAVACGAVAVVVASSALGCAFESPWLASAPPAVDVDALVRGGACVVAVPDPNTVRKTTVSRLGWCLSLSLSPASVPRCLPLCPSHDVGRGIL